MKKSIKIISIMMIAVIAMLSLAGCGSDEGTDASGDMPTYIAITEPTYAPFESTDDDGNLVGFDMDLLNAIAEDQGFKVEYQIFEFDALIPAVQAGNADIIAAAMNVTDERAEQVDFSEKYFDSGKVIVVTADNTTISGVDDLTADMSVAQGWAVFASVMPLAITGLISAIYQGKTSVSCIYAVAKDEKLSGKLIMFPAMVETYAIFGLVISLLFTLSV